MSDKRNRSKKVCEWCGKEIKGKGFNECGLDFCNEKCYSEMVSYAEMENRGEGFQP